MVEEREVMGGGAEEEARTGVASGVGWGAAGVVVLVLVCVVDDDDGDDGDCDDEGEKEEKEAVVGVWIKQSDPLNPL